MEPKTVTVNARITPAVHAALQALAEKQRRKVAAVIAIAIEEMIEREGPEKE